MTEGHLFLSFFFSSRRRHTRFDCDWSSDVCSSDIRFPLNFNSPYKAGSIIDFWARWHMTLTRYLTAYLYYPVAMAISRAREKRGLSVGSSAARTPGGFAATIEIGRAHV